MVCDTRTLQGQTLTERKAEVKKAVTALDAAIRERRVRIKIGPQGAIALEGWAEQDRGRVSDACAYRILMATGSALARAEFAKAEQLSGRSINRQAIAVGAHSHDNGLTWHNHKG